MRTMIATSKARAPAAPALATVLSLAGLILLWALAARLTADPEILPGPAAVARIVAAEAASGALARHVGATLARVIAAFTLAAAIGGALGLLLGMKPGLDRWFGPWVTVFLNLPALVVIVLCYLWIGLNETAAIAAVAINKAAMVTVTIREGVRGLDPGLSEMARINRLSARARFLHVVWPQLWPFVMTATRNGLAIIWKIVLVVEFLGRSSGVGFQIHLYFQLFDIGHVLAYSFAFVAVMLVLEGLVVQPLDRRSRLWQRRAAGSG